MKVMVVRKNGSVENVTLTEPLKIERGENLNALITATGMRHYFREDGVYDGWELDVSAMRFATPEEALAFANQVDSEREFPERPNEPIEG